MRKRGLILSVLLVATMAGAPLYGAILTLSTHASDGVNPPPAEQLDATMDFSVVDTTLTLSVTNLTPEGAGDPALKINEIYFNGMSNVTGMTLTDVLGSTLNKWSFDFIQGGGPTDIGNPHQVNGFGKFDAYVIDGEGTQPHVIDPGETVSFIFDIMGTGPFYDYHFIELSTQVDGHIISYGAAKFYNGPPEMSAYGATNVPEPATVALLGLGGLLLLRRRRR